LTLSDGVITRLPSIYATEKGQNIYKRAAKFAESKLYDPIEQ
jgi:hypothetical protein